MKLVWREDSAMMGERRAALPRNLAVRTWRMDDHVRVLVVDDDLEFVRMLGEFLSGQGIVVGQATSGQAALEEVARAPPDLVVLDITMPGLDGLETLQRLRSLGDVPVIMVTARGQPSDRIRGLELGADDYLAKPFDPHELHARIRAVLRRIHQGLGSRPTTSLGALRLDPAGMAATLNGRAIRLTSAEFMVLYVLAAAPGAPISRGVLTDRALGRPLEPFDRSLDTHVSNLRRKLQLTPHSGLEIRAVRGAGYALTIVESER